MKTIGETSDKINGLSLLAMANTVRLQMSLARDVHIKTQLLHTYQKLYIDTHIYDRINYVHGIDTPSVKIAHSQQSLCVKFKADENGKLISSKGYPEYYLCLWEVNQMRKLCTDYWLY